MSRRYDPVSGTRLRVVLPLGPSGAEVRVAGIDEVAGARPEAEVSSPTSTFHPSDVTVSMKWQLGLPSGAPPTTDRERDQRPGADVGRTACVVDDGGEREPDLRGGDARHHDARASGPVRCCAHDDEFIISVSPLFTLKNWRRHRREFATTRIGSIRHVDSGVGSSDDEPAVVVVDRRVLDDEVLPPVDGPDLTVGGVAVDVDRMIVAEPSGFHRRTRR